MSKGRIAPVRPSIAKILKRQIGGFIREYDREVNRPAASPAGPAKKPPAQPVSQPLVQPGAQPEQGKREETPSPQPPDSAESR